MSEALWSHTVTLLSSGGKGGRRETGGMLWGALEERDRGKSKYFPAIVGTYPVSHLLGTPQAGCLGLTTLPPPPPSRPLRSWAHGWAPEALGAVLFSWLVREIAIGAAGEQKSGQWQGFFYKPRVSGVAPVWRLPRAPHLLLGSAGGGLRVSREADRECLQVVWNLES